MPDAPKDSSQPLSASERGRPSVQIQSSLQTTVANHNNGHSAALQGATSAFAAQVKKHATTPGVKPGTAVNSNRMRARKAAILAGAASKVHARSQDGTVAADVKGRINQFSSLEPVSGATSQASFESTNPQHMAADLAVKRSASRTMVQHMPKHSGRTEQLAQSLGSGNYNSSISTKCSHTLDGVTAPSTNGCDGQLDENKTQTPASMQQFQSSSPFSVRHRDDEAANPQRSTQSLANVEGNLPNPALPPRKFPPNARSRGQNPRQILQHTLPKRDRSVQPTTGVVHSRQPLLPVGSQSNVGVPTGSFSRDALDDARVASSVASSRASTPAKATPLSPPPPPPPHRRTRSRSLLLGPSLVPRSDTSRTPSPSKSLRNTMRVESKSDNEREKKRSQHNRARILKRWRGKVTERERKRYEGVWAANKGLLLDPELHDMVVNVVVRDVWSRSRLAPHVLGCIWDLISHDAQAMALSREEFVVGMWLIDQSLQGRKLPWKVSDSVWDSVRQWSLAKRDSPSV